MNAPIWTTVLQPEPIRLPNNGSKDTPPTIYEWSGRIVVDSLDLAYYLCVSHDRLLAAWDALMQSADDPAWTATHYLPRTERFGLREGKPYHERDVMLTQEVTKLVIGAVSRKKVSSAAAVFEDAAACGTVVREPSRRASDIVKGEPARARARIAERSANGTNCADGDEATLALDDARWNGVRFEIVRPTVRNPAGTGRAWECKAYRINSYGHHQLSAVPAFDVRKQQWIEDQFVTIPDVLLVSLTAVTDHETLSREVADE